MTAPTPPDQRDRQLSASERRRRDHLAAAKPAPTFGTAGGLAGRGIMLGSNSDVWDQALALADHGGLDVVAVVPDTPVGWITKFTSAGLRVAAWYPPELADLDRSHAIEQAEKPAEWKQAISREPAAIVTNSWTYGRFAPGVVALVESYYNEGWGVDFGVFKNYMSQGAAGVIPVCGGYTAAGRSDVEAAAIYEHLATWGDGFPGFWMYAGEDLIPDVAVQVLRAWRPR